MFGCWWRSERQSSQSISLGSISLSELIRVLTQIRPLTICWGWTCQILTKSDTYWDSLQSFAFDGILSLWRCGVTVLFWRSWTRFGKCWGFKRGAVVGPLHRKVRVYNYENFHLCMYILTFGMRAAREFGSHCQDILMTIAQLCVLDLKHQSCAIERHTGAERSNAKNCYTPSLSVFERSIFRVCRLYIVDDN